MEFRNFILAGVLFVIVAQVVHTLDAMVGMNFYTDESYFPVWSKIMMPGPGAPPMAFYILSLAFSFLSALIYVYVYDILKKSVPGKGFFEKGLSYGALLFLVGGVPYSFSLMLLINLPFLLIAAWGFETFVVSIIGGVLIAKLVE
jgi:hypothetical protein